MKFIFVLLSIALLFSFCGCTAKKTATQSAQTPAQTESPTEATTETESPAPAAQTAVQDEISMTDTEKPIEYSNEISAKELITTQYSEWQLLSLEKELKEGKEFSYYELSTEFKFEYVRYADSEYYVALMLDNGKKAFLFFGENQLLDYMYIYTDFASKDDFDFVEIGKTTMDEVFDTDPNAHLLPFSCITCSVHVVKEGGIVVDYKVIDHLFRVNDLWFYENSELIKLDENDVAHSIPYILDIDKQ